MKGMYAIVGADSISARFGTKFACERSESQKNTEFSARGMLCKYRSALTKANEQLLAWQDTAFAVCTVC